MDSNLTQICRLCLETSDNLLNVFENYQQSTIALILMQHFWFQVDTNDGLPECLCEVCWTNVKTFHNFYKKIKCIHTNYWKSVQKINSIKQKRSFNLRMTVLKPKLNIVKYDKTELPVHMIALLASSKERSDYSNDNTCDPNEIAQASDQPFNEKPKNRDVGDSNIKGNPNISSTVDHTGKLTLSSQIERKKYAKKRKEAKDKEDAQIRGFFTIKCDICSDLEFETIIKFKKHYSIVHKKSGYLMCCDKKLSKRHSLLAHIRLHTNPDTHRCDKCGKSGFRDKHNLRSHMDSHTPLHSRAHKCNLCSSRFSRVSFLKVHVQNKHSAVTGETFTCDICNKNFRSKLLVSHHIRIVHVSSHKYVCEICARSFKTKHLLQNHIACIHYTTPLSKVQCDICSAWFKHEIGLQVHRKRQHETQNHNVEVKCPTCNKVTKNKLALRSHIRSTHYERRHQCSLCNKAFTTPLYLREHVATHTGEDLYSCLYCEKKFKSKANMYNHRKKSHFADWSRENSKAPTK